MRGATTAFLILLYQHHHFYSHAPCGARPADKVNDAPSSQFLLTRPMRGATLGIKTTLQERVNFYSHAPCGARQVVISADFIPDDFYSHAPCGARRLSTLVVSTNNLFLLTRPMRGATLTLVKRNEDFAISTHTPHAGRDFQSSITTLTSVYFYSHAPCGARPYTFCHKRDITIFLLTRPMRGATLLLFKILY